MSVTLEEMRHALEVLAREQVGPGESITVHDEGCAAMTGDACDCEPIVITVPLEVA